MQRGIVKRLASCIAMTSVVVNAYAVGVGPYWGFSTGPATNGSNIVQAQTMGGGTTPAYPRSNQWGFGMEFGNKINRIASIEGGFHYFTGIKYDTKNVNTCSTTQGRVRDLYIGGKAEGNFYSFTVFGKGALGVVYDSTSGALNPDPTMECGKSAYVTKFRPVLAIGASYDLNQSWVVDLTWTRILVGGQISSVDFYGLGLSYHFVDRYCGQFLCDD